MYKLDKDGCLDVSEIRTSLSQSDYPKGIKSLNCSDNDITSLDELPEGLIELYCSYNKLSFLHKLPNSLTCLHSSHNNMISLPKLNIHLNFLNCRYNSIKYLPVLPDGLDYLCCDNNPLECIIPSKFVNFQHADWMKEYYYPYINSYVGQKNILTREPCMTGELIKQTVIFPEIRKEFGHLINSCELNLI